MAALVRRDRWVAGWLLVLAASVGWAAGRSEAERQALVDAFLRARSELAGVPGLETHATVGDAYRRDLLRLVDLNGLARPGPPQASEHVLRGTPQVVDGAFPVALRPVAPVFRLGHLPTEAELIQWAETDLRARLAATTNPPGGLRLFKGLSEGGVVTYRDQYNRVWFEVKPGLQGGDAGLSSRLNRYSLHDYPVGPPPRVQQGTYPRSSPIDGATGVRVPEASFLSHGAMGSLASDRAAVPVRAGAVPPGPSADELREVLARQAGLPLDRVPPGRVVHGALVPDVPGPPARSSWEPDFFVNRNGNGPWVAPGGRQDLFVSPPQVRELPVAEPPEVARTPVRAPGHRMQQFQEAFTTRLRALDRRIPGAPAALAEAGMLATMYVFAVVQVARSEPGMELSEVLERAGQVAFSPQALAASGVLVGLEVSGQAGAAGLERLAASLQLAGRESAGLVFRLGGGLARSAAGPVSPLAVEVVVGTLDARARERARTERLNAIGQRYFRKSDLRIFFEALDPDRLDYALVLLEGVGWVGGQIAGTAATGNPVVGFVAGAGTAFAVTQAYQSLQERFFSEADALALADGVVAEAASHRVPASDGSPEGNARSLAELLKGYAAACDTLLARVEAGQGRVHVGFQFLAARLRSLAVVALGKAESFRERDRLVWAGLHQSRAQAGTEAPRREVVVPVLLAFTALEPEFTLRSYPGLSEDEGRRQQLLASRWGFSYMGDSGVYYDDFRAFRPGVDYRTRSGDAAALVAATVAEVRGALAALGSGTAVPTLSAALAASSLARPLHKMGVGLAEARAALVGLRTLTDQCRTRVQAMVAAAGPAGYPDGFEEVAQGYQDALASKVALHEVVQGTLATNLPQLGLTAEDVLADGRAQWLRALATLRALAGEAALADAPGEPVVLPPAPSPAAQPVGLFGIQ